MAKSTIKGLVGIFLLFLGIFTLVVGLAATSTGIILGLLGSSAIFLQGIVPIISSFGIVALIIAAIEIWFGYKWTVENEDKLIKILELVTGFIFLYIGLPLLTPPATLIGAIVILAGIVLVGRGFNFEIEKKIARLR